MIIGARGRWALLAIGGLLLALWIWWPSDAVVSPAKVSATPPPTAVSAPVPAVAASVPADTRVADLVQALSRPATLVECAKPMAAVVTTFFRTGELDDTDSALQGFRLRQALLQRLLNSADPQARVAGLALSASNYASQLTEPGVCKAGEGTVHCVPATGEKALAWQAAVEQAKAAAGEQAQALALLARDGQDASVYRMALRACKSPPEAAVGACAALSTWRWAELDPDNMAPWLELAVEARQGGDVSGLEYALNRAAAARRVSTIDGSIVQKVAAEMPPESNAFEQFSTILGAHLLAGDGRTDGVMFLGAMCAANDLDVNRRQLCSRLAMQLLQNGETMMDLNIGVVIAKKLKLPDEQWARAKAEYEFLRQPPPPASARDSTLADMVQKVCNTLPKETLDLVKVSMLGERAAMRAKHGWR